MKQSAEKVPMESVAISMNNDVDNALKKFECEYKFSKMDTMIHRFPAGLGGGISIRYPYMVVPRFVSIGPYYHGQKHLEKMEEVKKAAAFHFCLRIELTPDEVMKQAVFPIEDEARGSYYYSRPSKMDDNSCFAAMMFCDACFLLLYMDAYSKSYGEKAADHVVNDSMRRFLFSNRDSIDNDVMLLENQLPWLVIQALMRLAVSRKWDLKASVGSFIADMGNTFKIRESLERVTYNWDDEKDPPPHLLALLRRHKAEPSVRAATDDGDDALLPAPHKENPKVTSISATSPAELEEIGINLRAACSPTAAFSDMDLVKGRLLTELSLTPLSLSDTRASCLVNMAAFEVCTASRFGDDPNRTAVCSYLSLLDMFMGRKEDVHKLRSKGLLHGPHSDEEMLTFFKTVAKHLPDSGYHFAIVMAKIEDYKRKRYIWTQVYKWLYNNYVTIIKAVSILVTLIGLYRALLSLTKKD